MLKEAEARGFVDKGTHDLVLNGTEPAYLSPGTDEFFSPKATDDADSA